MAEVANANPLQLLEQQLLNAINSPTLALLGRPLIGNGAMARPGQTDRGGPRQGNRSEAEHLVPD